MAYTYRDFDAITRWASINTGFGAFTADVG